MNKKGKSFYLTCGIFLLTVVAIGWSVYCNVSDGKYHFNENKPSNIKTTVNDEKKNNSQEFECIADEDFKEFHKKDAKNNSFSKNLSEENFSEKNVKQVSTQKPDTPLVVYPTNNIVIKEFSSDNLIYSKTLGDWRIHEGTDFKADEGSMVKSITDGKVIDIYDDPFYGVTIAIEHDLGFTAYYCGLGNTTLVNKDDIVKPGQDIGSLKSVPSEVLDDPHLHLMIKKDNKFIDPLIILDKDNSEE